MHLGELLPEPSVANECRLEVRMRTKELCMFMDGCCSRRMFNSSAHDVRRHVREEYHCLGSSLSPFFFFFFTPHFTILNALLCADVKNAISFDLDAF